MNSLEVIPLTVDFINPLANYWDGLSDQELLYMGALRKNIPTRSIFIERLTQQLTLPDQQKLAFAMIAILEELPVGHCNLNPIEFGKTGKMHLHLWNPTLRKQGVGKQMVEQSIRVFFERFKLNKIICEPYAKNIGPNKVLQKTGFSLIKRYHTLPSPHCFFQEVNRWEIKQSDIV